MRLATAKHDAPAQFRAVRSWVRRKLGRVDHEDRVARVALTLFDLTRHLHGLAARDRRLLELAAMVHDVGRCIDDDTHPEEGARLLLEDPSCPLGQRKRRWLAYLTMYHRGEAPAAGRDAVLRDDDPHDRLRLVLALLRTADALDSRRIESPRLVMAMRSRRLVVTCYLEEIGPDALRVYGRRKKFRLLEELLGCRVEVELARARLLRMVA